MDTATTPTSPAIAPAKPATPRKSRRRWLLLLGFLALLIAAPACYFVIDDWLANRAIEQLHQEMDAEDPNWRWHDLVAEIKLPPDEENSAVQVRKIQALLKIKKKEFNPGPKWDSGPREFLDVRNARLTPEYEKLLIDAFKVVDPDLLPEARKLKDMPNGGFAIDPVENPFFELKLDYVQETRTIVLLLQCDSILRGQNGDHDGAIESCLAMLNTARSFKNSPFLISQLVRIAEHAIAVGAIERALAQGEVSEAHLQKLQELLELETADDTLYQAMRGERAGGTQICELLRARRLSFSQMNASMGAPSGGVEHVVDLFPSIILGSYPDYLRTMNEQVRAAKLKDAERAEALKKVEMRMRQNPPFLTRMIIPATMKVGQANQRSQAYLRTATAGVAVERFRVKTQRWPNSLDEVVKAGLLKEIPTDPYDSQPLRFKRLPSGALVYSVGPDKTDNGGTLNRSNPMAPNTDYGFELWLPPTFRGIAPLPDEAKK
jgi:hypothetical protein